MCCAHSYTIGIRPSVHAVLDTSCTSWASEDISVECCLIYSVHSMYRHMYKNTSALLTAVPLPGMGGNSIIFPSAARIARWTSVPLLFSVLPVKASQIVPPLTLWSRSRICRLLLKAGTMDFLHISTNKPPKGIEVKD